MQPVAGDNFFWVFRARFTLGSKVRKKNDNTPSYFVECCCVYYDILFSHSPGRAERINNNNKAGKHTFLTYTVGK